MPDVPRHRRDRSRFGFVWCVTFVSFVLVGVVFSLAQPKLSGADEAVHFLEAEAVWSGQLVPSLVARPAVASMEVGVLHVRPIATGDDVQCFNLHPNRPASCDLRDFTVAAKPSDTVSYIAREPPLPAFLNGLPIYFDPGPTGLYLGRLLDAMTEAACLATALAMAAVRRRPFLALGVVLALTPDALAATGVLGSSQLEIATASLMWTAVALLIDGERPTARFVTLLSLASALCVLSRPISFVWVALAAFAILLGCNRCRLVALLRTRAVVVGLGAVAVASGVALAWYLLATPPDVASYMDRFHVPPTRLGDLVVVLKGMPEDWLQTIGQTGGDYSGPWLMTLLWTSLLGLCIGAGLLWASRRRVLVVVVLIVALFAIPTAIKTVELPHLWEFWHGRYDIPTLSGIVILATASLDSAVRRVPELRRLATVAVALAGLGQIAEFVGVLRRFSVGLDGSLDPFNWHKGWNPPIPTLVLLPVGIVVIAAAYGLIVMHQRAMLRELPVLSPPAGTRSG